MQCSYPLRNPFTILQPYRKVLVTTGLLVAWLLLVAPSPSVGQQATTVEITLSDQVAANPTDGRLMVFFSKRNPRPMTGPNWFGPEPFFGVEVVAMKPGIPVTVDDTVDSFPTAISRLAHGEYFVQAVLDHDFYCSNQARGKGNFYSKARKVRVDGQPIKLLLDQVVAGPSYRETKYAKLVEIKSSLLQKFHQREVVERALVVLPRSYERAPDRRYPTYYDVTGFGGTLEQLQSRWANGPRPAGEGQTEFIRVYLTGQCKWGHHVYANSDTNGPRGDALIKEMIPEIDRRFRTIAQPTARFVGGHSSGGWSSLWLQVNYPEMFGGVWSTSPDPVDFRDWQGTDLYASQANVFFNANGSKKPLARAGGRVLVNYVDFNKMDDVIGQGGQIRSFDAVFSPRNSKGQPEHCWDRDTGKVNANVLEHWKRYDISLQIQENWDQLAPKLKSKIHVYMGDQDTFYLEGATVKLGERLQSLGSDAVVEIFPGKDHGTLLTASLRNRILREMSEQFWKSHPKANQQRQLQD